MEILPVNDLDIALHEFVNKDDKMAFYSCLQYNLEETRVNELQTFSNFKTIDKTCNFAFSTLTFISDHQCVTHRIS